MSKDSNVIENGGAKKPIRALKSSKRSRLLLESSFGVLGLLLVGVCLVCIVSFFGYRSVANSYGLSDKSTRFLLLKAVINNNTGSNNSSKIFVLLKPNNISNNNSNKNNDDNNNNNNNNSSSNSAKRLFLVNKNKNSSSNSSKRVGFLEDNGNGCDVFDGDWVWDESYPLYQSKDCRFLDEGFKCSDYGRSDLFYTHWRWQPRQCNLPRFDAKLMLEKLRNKRLVFVGDSVGRNQWESLLCLLSSGIKKKSLVYEINGSPITKHKGFLVFKFKEYNCTVEYYRSPFLVPQGRPPIGSPGKVRLTLKLDSMDWTSSKWRDADVLVLNTGHWWNNGKTITTGCYFQEGEEVKLKMNVDDAYKRSLSTVVKWIQTEVDSNRTQVFFRTFAPLHFRGGNRRTRGTCHMETLPELGKSTVSSETWEQSMILGDVLSRYSNRSETVKMKLLNITAMAAQRKDGHPSLYYLGSLSPAPLHLQDCSHWCLPGVPDTWNELLYALFMKQKVHSSSSKSRRTQ